MGLVGLGAGGAWGWWGLGLVGLGAGGADVARGNEAQVDWGAAGRATGRVPYGGSVEGSGATGRVGRGVGRHGTGRAHAGRQREAGLSIGSSTRGCFVQGGRPAGQKRVSLTTGPKGRPKEAQVEGPRLFGVVNEGALSSSPIVNGVPFCPAKSPREAVLSSPIANKSRLYPPNRQQVAFLSKEAAPLDERASC